MATVPNYKPEVIEAMKEAKRISRDPNTKKYTSFQEIIENMECSYEYNDTDSE